jgi:tripartite-type tricarboxylate transporter receptor subunit TctC
MTHVPYKGRASAIPDLLGGRVTMMFDNMPSSLPLVKEGKLRALGVTSLKRSPARPRSRPSPSRACPASRRCRGSPCSRRPATPKPVVDRLQGEVKKILALPDIAASSPRPASTSSARRPEELAAYQRAEIAKWAKVVKDSGAKVE